MLGCLQRAPQGERCASNAWWVDSLALLDFRSPNIADANGELAEKLGLTVDLRKMGMGVRSRRYAMILENLVVKFIALDEMGLVTADAILKANL